MNSFFRRETSSNVPDSKGSFCALARAAVSGTFESIYKNGTLHLGTTYPSSGAQPERAAVSAALIRSYGIRPGDAVTGSAVRRQNGAMELRTVRTINGMSVERAFRRPDFYRLVPVYPTEQLVLSVDGAEGAATLREIDAVAPIGKGSRVLITAPACSGKTLLLGEIAGSIQINHPEVKLFVLMIGSWPEETAYMHRVVHSGETIISDRLEKPRNHVRAAVATVERAKRLVELGQDVVILLDGIVNLADACNSVGTGRGIGCAAWVNAVTLFGSARNIEDGGSLTMVATAFERAEDETAYVMTGSSNATIHLRPNRRDAGSFPVLDLERSWTRRADLLTGPGMRPTGRRARRPTTF